MIGLIFEAYPGRKDLMPLPNRASYLMLSVVTSAIELPYFVKAAVTIDRGLVNGI
jgi:hypothetical protein